MTKMEKVMAWLDYNNVKATTKKGQAMIDRLMKYDDALLDSLLGPRGLLK